MKKKDHFKSILFRRKALCVIALLAAFAGPARGHDLRASWTTAILRPDSCELLVKMHAESVVALIQEKAPGASFEPENFESLRPALESFAHGLYELRAGGRALAATETHVTAVEDNLEFRLVYPRPAGEPLSLKADFLSRVAPDFIAHVNVTDDAGKQLSTHVLRPDEPSAEIARASGVWGSFASFLKLGVEHILKGYDHLLFLLGLLIACRRFKTMAVIVTCFTLAHSVTLGLAALDVLSLSPRVVEPLIAASIVFVGVENLVRRDEPRRRWLLTLAFGLIHGFGFAGALREAGLGSAGSSLLLPLFSFNLGVELGQIGVAAVVLPLLWWLRRLPAAETFVHILVSALLMQAGAYWLVMRLFYE